MNASPLVQEFGLRTVGDLCALVDELDPAATGEIAVHRADRAHGAVFVERGRVCWAAARGLARRLTELLRVRTKLPPGSMEALFVTCKQQNVPLGEHLVARGLLSAEDLREALLQHTVESLTALCADPARAAWCARLGKGYGPRFTFTTAELLVSVCARAHGPAAAALAPILVQSFDEEDWGVAFVPGQARAAWEPVAVHGHVPHAAKRLLRMGEWAAGALCAASRFTDDGAFIATTRARGDQTSCLIAFRHEGAIVTGETGVHGPARIMNRRARTRRTSLAKANTHFGGT